jgi:hypothetical protein
LGLSQIHISGQHLYLLSERSFVAPRLLDVSVGFTKSFTGTGKEALSS